MLGLRALLLLFVITASSCSRDVPTHRVKPGQIKLGLAQIDQNNFAVILVNRSKSKVVINSLFDAGYVQSPLTYEFKSSSLSIRSNQRTAATIPVFLNIEKYRIQLSPDEVYGKVLAKDNIASLLSISPGKCYEIRVVYNAPDNSYTQNIEPSEFVNSCF